MRAGVVLAVAAVASSAAVGAEGASPLRTLPRPEGYAPVAAVQGLVSRVLGDRFLDHIDFAIDDALGTGGNDEFELSTAVNGTLRVRGSSGVALASGLYWFLKNACNSSLTWGEHGSGDKIAVPLPLPPLAAPIRRKSLVPYRYAWNVCTVSYTAVWWNWSRWERELDWMALHGVNLVLSFTGQEHVWYSLYEELGLTDAEIQRYLSGPAFLAWQRMNNLRGWGGPLDGEWRDGQRQLQHQILGRARALGMWSVLPGFSGRIPAAITRLYPNISITHNALWSGFNGSFSGNALIEPTDPHFASIAARYYALLAAEFGSDHVFNSDTYNEMDPASSDPDYLTRSNAAVYDAMAAADSGAVYVMQGWLFHSKFWNDASRIKAYLAGVPSDSMLVLDLNTEEQPVWDRTDSYFGKPWCWCMLHNYGGRRGIYGDMTRIATGPVADAAAPGATMACLGFTPEALETNPAMYELLTDMAWREAPVGVGDWLRGYVAARYTGWDDRALAAWLLLAGPGQPYDTPWSWQRWSRLEYAPTLGAPQPLFTGHNATAVTAALRLLLAAGASGALDAAAGPFLYDVTDFARQTLSNAFADAAGAAQSAYAEWARGGAAAAAAGRAAAALGPRLVSMAKDADSLLCTCLSFLFGVWQARARAAATTAAARRNREFNARNQVTLWGPDGEIDDYAAKQWGGLVGAYHARRWQLWSDTVQRAVASGAPANETAFAASLLALGRAWNAGNDSFPDAPCVPAGRAFAAVRAIVTPYLAPTAAQRRLFEAVPGADFPGHDIGRALSHDADQLLVLCAADPECAGFNTNGWLKRAAPGPQQPSPGVTFYRRRADPAGRAAGRAPPL